MCISGSSCKLLLTGPSYNSLSIIFRVGTGNSDALEKKSPKLILQYSKDWDACLSAGVGVGGPVPLFPF